MNCRRLPFRAIWRFLCAVASGPLLDLFRGVRAFYARAAGAAPLVGHRSEAYFALLEEIVALLKKLLRVSQPVITLPSSGTGALEALAANLLDPGDAVISFSCGAFGDRFREIA